MRTKEVERALSAALATRQTMLLVGLPGVGKSAIAEAVAAREGWKWLTTNLPTVSPVDMGGFPYPDPQAGFARQYPVEDVYRVLTATEPTVWIWDDLIQAPEAVQNAAMQWLHPRRIGCFTLPDCVVIWATTNAAHHHAGGRGITAPMRGRFASIVEVEAFYEDWREWAVATRIHPHVVAFHDAFMGKDLVDKDTSHLAGMGNTHSPRTWEAVSRWAYSDLPRGIRAEVYEGACGPKGREFAAFESRMSSIVGARALLEDPLQTPLPTAADELYATTISLAYAVDASTIGACVHIMQRLAPVAPEHMALLARDTLRTHPELATARAFVDFLKSKEGQRI